TQAAARRMVRQGGVPLPGYVNAVCPGYTSTALMETLLASKAIDGEALLARTPLRRFGAPQEMAEVALFLASDSAAFITGHALVSDGGWTADGF
ncbi:short-chain dehydrogenase/reductase SDR, partial [Cupriavidus basilensis OR16]